MTKLKLIAMGILLSALYEQRLASNYHVPIRMGIFVVGSGIAVELSSNLMAWIFSRTRWLRRMFFARRWVEGAWYVQTLEPGKTRPLAEGIATFQYVGDDLRPEIDIEKPRDSAAGLPTVTKSLLAAVNDDLSYINVFKYSIGADSQDGIAIGSFRTEDKPYPTLYDGRYILFEKDEYKRQTGFRIESRVVKKYRTKYGLNWKDAYLQAKARGEV